jgi:hypothetical protein
MTNAAQIREAAGRFATIDLHTETKARLRIQQTGRNRPTRNRVGPSVLLPFDQRAGKGRESQFETIRMLKRHPFAFNLFVASLISFQPTRFSRPLRDSGQFFYRGIRLPYAKFPRDLGVFC